MMVFMKDDEPSMLELIRYMEDNNPTAFDMSQCKDDIRLPIRTSKNKTMADIEIITLSQAVETIKTAILQSQARAARNVSANQLALYFSVGGYISLNTRQQQWGSGAIETISERLQKRITGTAGI